MSGEEAIGHADAARSLAIAARCVACGRDTDVSIAEVYARFDRLDDAREALDRWDAVGRPSWVEAEWQRRRAGVLLAAAAAAGGSDDVDVDIEASLTRLRDEAAGWVSPSTRCGRSSTWVGCSSTVTARPRRRPSDGQPSGPKRPVRRPSADWPTRACARLVSVLATRPDGDRDGRRRSGSAVRAGT